MLWHNSEEVPDSERLERTARLLQHRGPDAHGVFAGPGVGLVHTRLSLLDLNARSNQPFWDRQRRYALVYNGEIYNFAELRTELAEEGVEFWTTCDTEVLLEALLKWGADATLPRLEGMFAFGLYDRQEKSLLLARDRYGVKPLFVYDTPDAFMFASEIRALRPWMKFEPDLLSISSFLSGFAGPHKGFTFFRNVKFVDPGSAVTVRVKAKSAHRRFFSLPDFVRPEEHEHLAGLSRARLVDRLDELLNESVRSQLVADAPVGALCSGGVDSALIMAIASRYHNNLAIFHADIVGPLSEFDAASWLARHLKLDLKKVEVRDQDFVDRIPQTIEHYGHPFYPNPHAIPFLMVSELVRRSGVKAVLTGEGSDECFLGYHWLAPDLTRRIGFRTPGLKALVKWLLRRPGRDPRMAYWGPVWEGDSPMDLALNQKALVSALHNRFETVSESVELRRRLLNSNHSNCARNCLDVLKTMDLLNYNLRTLLHRNDSAGMAASIESRFPFLDSRLVGFAVNLPRNVKIRFSPFYFDRRHYFFKDKWIVRKVAERYLPSGLSQRRKLGFCVSAPERMRVAASFFERSFLRELFGLSSSEIHLLLDHAGQALQLRLLQLEVWASLFVLDSAADVIQDKLRKDVRVIAN